MGMRSVKRAFSFILSFVMIAGVCFASLPNEVKAADNIVFSVTADKSELKPEDEVTVTIKMSGNQNDAYFLQYEFQFDDSKLECLEYKLGEVADGVMGSVNLVGNQVKLAIVGSGLAPLPNGTVVTMRFKVKETAQAGKLTFTSTAMPADSLSEHILPSTINDNTNLTVSIPASGISLNKQTTTIARGKTEKLTATLEPSGASSEVKWSSDNTSVATVSNDGTVTAVKAGTANITATANGHKATCKVTVNVPLERIKITGTASTIKKGTTAQLSVTYEPEDTTDAKTVIWSSDDTNVATVNQSGLVTAVADGTANITAKVGSVEATYAITVQEVELNGISIKSATTIHRGESEALEVTYDPENTTDDRTVSWESSDPLVATVDGSGKVEAIKPGQADITATVGNHKATCKVTVDAPLKNIIPSVTKLELIKNQTAAIAYTLDPADTTDSTAVVFSSSAPDVAAVDSTTGLVTAKKEGTATITLAGANNITATVPVTVSEIPIDKVVLDKQSAIVEKGDTTELTANVDPANTTDDDTTITWTSSDESVATVSQETTDNGGQVTITATDKGGKATITATAWNGTKAECTITVPVHIDSISLPQDVTLDRKETKVLDVTYDPETHDDQVKVEWSSDNEDVAAVDAKSGTVTAVKKGMATITAKVTATTLTGTTKEYTATTKVTVQENHLGQTLGDTIAFADMKEALLKGQSADMYDQLNLAKILEDNAITDDITIQWTSSEEAVASIDQTGRITGQKEGTTTVTAVITAKDGEGQTIGEYTVETEVEVQEIPLESIAFDKIIKEMQVGAVETLHIIYNPENTTDLREVVWSSSDPSVLTVENGKLTALKPGAATITAKVGDKEVSCKITVKAAAAGDKQQGDQKGSGDGAGAKDKAGDEGFIRTGDPANIILCVALFVGSMAAIVLIRRRRHYRVR